MPQELLTVPEAARILRVPVPRAYALCREGILPSVAVGRRQVRISPDALEQFIATGGRKEPDA